MGDAILLDVLIIFLVSVPVVLIAHYLRFSSIVGFLITGVIIGPHVLKLIPDVAEIQVLAEVGVALLLFSIGLEFSFDRLKGWGTTAFLMGAVQVALTVAAGVGFGLSLGLGAYRSAFLGCTAALSSTAIVLAVLSFKRWFDAPAGRISIGILICQDLAVVPMMVLLSFFTGLAASDPVRTALMALVHVCGLAAALYVLSRWVLNPILHHISMPRSKELFVVVIVGIAIGAGWATQKMGLSYALGAFLAGILVSTTPFRFHALSEIAPFRYCFNGLFFVALGMIVDPSFVVQNLPAVAVLTFFMLLAKIVITGGTVVAFGYPVSVAVVTALMLAQVGEFSFMLLFYGREAGAIDGYFYQLLIDAAALTMIAAPFLLAAAPAMGEKLAFVGSPLAFIRRRRAAPLPDEGEKLEGHAIICGFGTMGMTVGRILERHGMEYVVLELNPVTFTRHRRKGRRIFIGDGASADLLGHSNIEKARILAVAVPDHLNAMAILTQARSMNPDIFIITRCRYRDQVENFYDSGADVVVCEELEAGIEMGRYVLEKLGVEHDLVAEIVGEIRAFGSADFF